MKTVKTIANGQPLCSLCAYAEQVKISREFRPLVGQWVKFSEVRLPNAVQVQCTKCHRSI